MGPAAGSAVLLSRVVVQIFIIKTENKIGTAFEPSSNSLVLYSVDISPFATFIIDSFSVSRIDIILFLQYFESLPRISLLSFPLNFSWWCFSWLINMEIKCKKYLSLIHYRELQRQTKPARLYSIMSNFELNSYNCNRPGLS